MDDESIGSNESEVQKSIKSPLETTAEREENEWLDEGLNWSLEKFSQFSGRLPNELKLKFHRTNEWKKEWI